MITDIVLLIMKAEPMPMQKGRCLAATTFCSEECKNGGKNCPGLNEDNAELKNADDTAILGKRSRLTSRLIRR